MADRSTALTAIFTPGYAAGEQMTSAKQGPWTDIYGLSATLYHAITGKPPPSAFDRILEDEYKPLARLNPAGFSPGILAGVDAGLSVTARGRPQSITGLRSVPAMTGAPSEESTALMPKTPTKEPAPVERHVPILTPEPASPPAAAGTGTGKRAGLWIALAIVVLALLGGGGGYYALYMRGPDPEILKREQAAKEEEARRFAAEQEAARLRAEAEQRQKEEEAAAARKRQEEAEAAAQKQREEEARRKAEAEAAEKQREEEARRKAEEEAEARRKAIEDARKAVEFVAGPFDHFGKSLMDIRIKDKPDDLRLQGVDIVNDPALLKVGEDALAAQPRH